MAEYRVYRLDGVSRETSAEWLEAKTDEEAVAHIQRNMRSSIRCQIWCGNRIVKLLEAPPSPDRNG